MFTDGDTFSILDLSFESEYFWFRCRLEISEQGYKSKPIKISVNDLFFNNLQQRENGKVFSLNVKQSSASIEIYIITINFQNPKFQLSQLVFQGLIILLTLYLSPTCRHMSQNVKRPTFRSIFFYFLSRLSVVGAVMFFSMYVNLFAFYNSLPGGVAFRKFSSFNLSVFFIFQSIICCAMPL